MKKRKEINPNKITNESGKSVINIFQGLIPCAILVSLKMNGTRLTNNSFQFHATNYEVSPLRSNPSLVLCTFPLCSTGRLLLGCLQLHRHGILDGHHAFKTGPFDDTLEHEWKKKVTRCKMNRETAPVWQCSYRYTQSHYFSDTPKSSVIIFKTLLFFTWWLVIIRTVKWQSSHTTCLIRSTLASVLLVVDLSLLQSLFTLLRLYLNLLWHSKTRVCDASKSISSAYDGVFPKRTKNFRLIHSSVLLAERPKKSCKKHVKKMWWLLKVKKQVGRVFANDPGDRGSIPGRFIQKTQKWYLIPSCLTQHYKVGSPTPRCRGAFGSPSNTVANTSRKRHKVNF